MTNTSWLQEVTAEVAAMSGKYGKPTTQQTPRVPFSAPKPTNTSGTTISFNAKLNKYEGFVDGKIKTRRNTAEACATYLKEKFNVTVTL